MQQIQFIGTTPTALIELIDETISKRLNELKNNFQPKEPTEFLTRHDVSKMLSVDLSTIHNWSKNGKIQPYSVGGRVYFKRNEIENSLIKLNK